MKTVIWKIVLGPWLATGGPVAGLILPQETGWAAETQEAITPPPGSPIRQEILAVLRQGVRRLVDIPVVFTVRHLKVSGDWAYVIAEPQSPDGTSRFEPLEVLLQRRGGTWRALKYRPCCGDCAYDPDCADDRRYYRKLQRRYPRAPQAIFPQPAD